MTNSDPFATLLVDLGRTGIELATNGDEIRFRPVDRVSPDLLARIQAHKDTLILLVGPDDHAAGRLYPTSDATSPEAVSAAIDVYIERLGIADELGHETHVGSPAWLIAMGEAIAAESAVLAEGVQR